MTRRRTTRDVSPIGEKIRELRKLRGWGAHALCAQTSGVVSYSTVSKLECGISQDISLSHAQALASALGVPVSSLVDPELSAEALAIATEIADAKMRLLRVMLEGKIAEVES